MVIRSAPWIVQPQGGAGIDRNNPITRGLLVAGIPILGAPANTLNKNSFRRVFAGTGASGGRRLEAMIYGSYTTSANGSGVTVPDILYDGGEFSLLTVRVGTVNQGSDEAGTGAGGAGEGWKLSFSGNANTPALTVNGTTVVQSNWYATTPRRTGPVLHVFKAASFDSWSKAVPGKASTAHSITTSTSTQSLTFGGYLVGGVFTSGGGASGLLAYWNRALTDGEARAVTANPWILFEKQKRQIWAIGSAGGGGFLPAWARRQTRTIGAGLI